MTMRTVQLPDTVTMADVAILVMSDPDFAIKLENISLKRLVREMKAKEIADAVSEAEDVVKEPAE